MIPRPLMLGDAVRFKNRGWSGILQTANNPAEEILVELAVRDGNTWKIREQTVNASPASK